MSMGRYRAMGERGAALAVSLILLLVMTIVGIAAMNGARLEIAMAGLMQQEVVALRRAEQTLADAEVVVQDIADDPNSFEFGDDDGFYLPANNLDATISSWAGFTSELGPNTTDNSTDDDDAYVVEYLGAKIIPGEIASEEMDPPIDGGVAHTYRVTTRSATGAKAVRIIEAIYTTIEAP